MEHTLEFDRELEATFDFEFGEHASLRVIRYRSVVKETFSKVGFIISLEDVLFCDEPEQADGLI
jgi:hypothetical protein